MNRSLDDLLWEILEERIMAAYDESRTAGGNEVQQLRDAFPALGRKLTAFAMKLWQRDTNREAQAEVMAQYERRARTQEWRAENLRLWVEQQERAARWEQEREGGAL